MKSVLISIQPKWCELIASGKKTVEVRKTKPKIDMPFKCYIYCTYGEGLIEANDEVLPNHLIEYKVSKGKTWGNCCNGKVIGEFVCDFIYHNISFDCSQSCVSVSELKEYSNGKPLYAWHISDLVIYDKPKELSEFFYACDKPKGTDCSECLDRRENKCKAITRPPQSWCYVEEVDR